METGEPKSGRSSLVSRLRCPRYESAALLILVLCVRLPGTLPSVMDWDESIYVLSARALLHGGLPYVSVFDNKPLGAPAMIAAAMAVLGSSVLTVRLLGGLAVATTTLLLPPLATLLGLSRPVGLTSAVLYAAFSTKLQATNTELLFAPFTVAALCVAAAGWDAQQSRTQIKIIAGMGLLFGMAIWIKYVAVVPAAIIFGTIVGVWLVHGHIHGWGSVSLAALYGIAIALPTALTATAYAAVGQFSTFWYCNFGYMGTYLAMRPGYTGSLVKEGLRFIWPLLFLSLLGIWFIWPKQNAVLPRKAAIVLIMWTVAEVIALVAPWKFWPHYFIMLLPPLTLLSGVALFAIADRISFPRLRRAAPYAFAGAIALIPLVVSARYFIRVLANPDIPRQVAAVISSDTAPSAWVVNSQPIIYFLAGIPAPPRFPFPPHLASDQSALTGIDPLAEVDRILATRPRFLVVDEGNWGRTPIEVTVRAKVQEALARDYEKVASFTSRLANANVFRLRLAPLPPTPSAS
jgi:4-amino-4-deoxy-L-arabinose transferase-like glycosyltransferase